MPCSRRCSTTRSRSRARTSRCRGGRSDVGSGSPRLGSSNGTWGAAWPTDVDAAVRAFAEAERAEAGIEALLANRSLGAWFFDALAGFASQALSYARVTLPALPVSTPPLARAALFTVFSASGVDVPEDADLRFPLAYRLPGEPLSNRVTTRWLVDHLRAVAASRRDLVVEAAMRRVDGGNPHAAIHLLEHASEVGPLPRTMAMLVAYLERAKKARTTALEKKTLAELARRVKGLVPATTSKRLKVPSTNAAAPKRRG